MKVSLFLITFSFFRYSILFNDHEFFHTINTKPKTFSNNKVYSGDKYFEPADALIEDLDIVSPLTSTGE